jgi:predicted O-methyltransferase YrrM
MDKHTLTLAEVIQQLTPPEPLNDYLDALYQLGQQRQIPNISPANVTFLQNLLEQRKPKNILEIGCANGYSTLRFWQVAKAWQAKITTMDISKPSVEEAKHHFAALHTNIELHFGNALEIFPSLPKASFDFIFIDAQKSSTLDFFVRSRKLAMNDALIVVDDVLKFKDKMQRFYDYLEANDITYEIEQVDVDDGVMLIQL